MEAQTSDDDYDHLSPYGKQLKTGAQNTLEGFLSKAENICMNPFYLDSFLDKVSPYDLYKEESNHKKIVVKINELNHSKKSKWLGDNFLSKNNKVRSNLNGVSSSTKFIRKNDFMRKKFEKRRPWLLTLSQRVCNHPGYKEVDLNSIHVSAIATKNFKPKDAKTKACDESVNTFDDEITYAGDERFFAAFDFSMFETIEESNWFGSYTHVNGCKGSNSKYKCLLKNDEKKNCIKKINVEVPPIGKYFEEMLELYTVYPQNIKLKFCLEYHKYGFFFSFQKKSARTFKESLKLKCLLSKIHKTHKLIYDSSSGSESEESFEDYDDWSYYSRDSLGNTIMDSSSTISSIIDSSYCSGFLACNLLSKSFTQCSSSNQDSSLIGSSFTSNYDSRDEMESYYETPKSRIQPIECNFEETYRDRYHADNYPKLNRSYSKNKYQKKNRNSEIMVSDSYTYSQANYNTTTKNKKRNFDGNQTLGGDQERSKPMINNRMHDKGNFENHERYNTFSPKIYDDFDDELKRNCYSKEDKFSRTIHISNDRTRNIIHNIISKSSNLYGVNEAISVSVQPVQTVNQKNRVSKESSRYQTNRKEKTYSMPVVDSLGSFKIDDSGKRHRSRKQANQVYAKTNKDKDEPLVGKSSLKQGKSSKKTRIPNQIYKSGTNVQHIPYTDKARKSKKIHYVESYKNATKGSRLQMIEQEFRKGNRKKSDYDKILKGFKKEELLNGKNSDFNKILEHIKKEELRR